MGAPLFSLRFSYYTEINAVELLRTPRRLWTPGEGESFCLFSSPRQPVSIFFFSCRRLTDGLAHARRDVARLFRRANKHGAVGPRRSAECVRRLIRSRTGRGVGRAKVRAQRRWEEPRSS